MFPVRPCHILIINCRTYTVVAHQTQNSSNCLPILTLRQRCKTSLNKLSSEMNKTQQVDKTLSTCRTKAMKATQPFHHESAHKRSNLGSSLSVMGSWPKGCSSTKRWTSSASASSSRYNRRSPQGPVDIWDIDINP